MRLVVYIFAFKIAIDKNILSSHSMSALQCQEQHSYETVPAILQEHTPLCPNQNRQLVFFS